MYQVAIDETMIPYRGRLGFRQYIPNKRHKYGLKLYKLCIEGGYTWNLILYAGKDTTNGNGNHSQSVVLDLMSPMLYCTQEELLSLIISTQV